MATLGAIVKKDFEDKKFMASLQGVDLEGEQKVEDIVSVTGSAASKEGFGVGLGLGYVSEDNV